MARKRASRSRPGPAPATNAVPGVLASPWIVAAALVVLGAVVFGQVSQFAFVNWDDPQYITANRYVAGGLTWPNVWWALTTGHAPYWHPLTWLSHLADVEYFGLDAGAHHLTNLMIHLLSTVVLFAVLRRITDAAWPSALVAAIFAVHPLHVESVAWVSERKDVLSTLALWLTLALYVRYTRRPGAAAYAGVIVMFGLALMAKPMVVTLPLLMLLLDVWPLRRVLIPAPASTWRRLVLEKVPLIVLAGMTSAATLLVQQQVGATAGLDVLPWSIRVANAIVATAGYVGHAFWPVHLSAFYPYPRVFPPLVVAGAAALLGVITVAAAVQIRQRPYLLVGWLWFLIALSPVLGFLQAGEQAMADRFMYVPIVGLALMAAWVGRDLAEKHPRLRLPIGVAGVAVVLWCAAAAHAQAATWRDSVTLWTHALSVTTDNYLAEEKLAEALRDRSEFDGALAHYTRALALAPESAAYRAVIQNDLGIVLNEVGRRDEALVHFEEAVRLNALFAEARTNLGNALAAAGRPGDALPHFEAAAGLDPSAVEAHLGRGNVLIGLGRPAEAAEAFATALSLDPSLAQAHNGLGSALVLQDRLEEGAGEYALAIRQKPDLTSARVNLAVVRIRQARPAEARRELEAVLAIAPDHAEARRLLASLR